MAKTKTGIFSGSFNPIHIGHLALANYLCEFEGLDEVWFMVTPHNPSRIRLIYGRTNCVCNWYSLLLRDIRDSGYPISNFICPVLLIRSIRSIA